MATVLATGNPIVWPNAVTNWDMDGLADQFAVVFIAPYSGDIERIGLYVSGGTGGPEYAVRVETVSGSFPGAPTGTLVNAGASGTVEPTSTGLWWITLSTPATVTAGTAYAVRVKYSSGDIGGDDYIAFTLAAGTIADSMGGCPYALTTTTNGLSWTEYYGMIPSVTIEYDDDTTVPGCGAIATAGEFAWNLFTSRYGCVWYPEAGDECLGMMAQIRATSNSSGNMLIRLMEGNDSSPNTSNAVRSYTISDGVLIGEVSTGINDGGVLRVQWEPYQLDPSYRYWLEISASVSNLRVGYCDFADSIARDAVAGPIGGYKYTSAFPGTYDIDANRYINIQPVLRHNLGRRVIAF
jgi:hypothetical protein